MPSPSATRVAAVLERLLRDPEFRSQFRRAPAATLERSGYPDLARELRGDGRALQTLEARESRSSVAAALMSAAEGIEDHRRSSPARHFWEWAQRVWRAV